MVKYNFKSLQPILNGLELSDYVLRKTMRRTPTVVHPQYQIGRIRKFYMRKVKYSQQLFNEKLSAVVDEFPILDDIHPFYADLLNVLYDRDHYKLALGQVSTCRRHIDNVGRDYIKLLKYADSLYRCKQLKRAALGRMATLIKKQSASLEYLEQVRQHLSRLPSIDPGTRTLILCGYPNVGKSSFMNKITRADVEVQPYAFTTKSLFVGHTDYKYLRWQVIDTPGLLDHPLADRNTIEMQSITALAHLRAAVVYIIDISTTCGYSIAQQVELFNSIKPLFANKPLVIAINKIDLTSLDELTPEERALLEEMVSGSNIEVMPMSTLMERGIYEVRDKACDKLLTHRVEAKLKGKELESILSRVALSLPKARDDRERPAFIPDSILRHRAQGNDDVAMITERMLEDLNGGSGVYQPDFKKFYELDNSEWKEDKIPEIIDGYSVLDFVDPQILEKLEALEAEEEQLLAEAEAESEESDLDDELVDTVEKIRAKKKVMKQVQALRSRNHVPLGRQHKKVDVDSIARDLKERGVDEDAVERARSKSRGRSSSRRSGSRAVSMNPEEYALEAARGRSVSEVRALSEARNKSGGILGKRSRSQMERSMTPARNSSVRNVRRRIEAQTDEKRAVHEITKQGRTGEADRRVFTLKPKHLFAGKRTIGKTERR